MYYPHNAPRKPAKRAFMQSIRNTKSFKIVYNNGRHVANHLFVMYAFANDTDASRLGLSISKKVGNAVTRNRVRRLTKESLRLKAPAIATGFDIVIVARAATGALPREGSFQKVDKSLGALLARLALIKAPTEAN